MPHITIYTIYANNSFTDIIEGIHCTWDYNKGEWYIHNNNSDIVTITTDEDNITLIVKPKDYKEDNISKELREKRRNFKNITILNNTYKLDFENTDNSSFNGITGIVSRKTTCDEGKSQYTEIPWSKENDTVCKKYTLKESDCLDKEMYFIKPFNNDSQCNKILDDLIKYGLNAIDAKKFITGSTKIKELLEKLNQNISIEDHGIKTIIKLINSSNNIDNIKNYIETKDNEGINLMVKEINNGNLNEEIKKIKKKKILCLHGFEDSGKNFKESKNMVELMKSLSEFEFIFATAPIKKDIGYIWYEEQINKEELTTNKNNANESIEYLNSFIENYGYFDGLLGYSQGCAMAMIYLSIGKQKDLFKFVVLFNGYLPITHKGLMDIIYLNQKSFTYKKSLVYMSRKDKNITSDISKSLSNLFYYPVVIESENASNNLPEKNDDAYLKVVDFIKKSNFNNNGFIIKDNNYYMIYSKYNFNVVNNININNLVGNSRKQSKIIYIKQLEKTKVLVEDKLGRKLNIFEPIDETIQVVSGILITWNIYIGNDIKGPYIKVTVLEKEWMNKLELYDIKIQLQLIDIIPKMIYLEYNKCTLPYILDKENRSNVGYLYNGYMYIPEKYRYLRYSKDGIVTEDYISCRITIIGDSINNNLSIE